MYSRLFLFLVGKITFQLEKSFETRVLNLCRKKGIPLDQVHVEQDRICISIPAKYRVIFSEILSKTNTKAVILKEYGLPFLLKKLSVKMLFVIGLFAAFFLLTIQTQFIWEFQFEGNSRLTDSFLKEYLKNENVYIGMPAWRLDIASLEEILRDNISNISWVSCKKEGAVLHVSVKELDEYCIAEDNPDGQYNIYSLCDGTVTNIIVRNGFPLVKQGEYVSKGQLLVQGVVPVFNDDGSIREEVSIYADADILIEYAEKLTFSVPKVNETEQLTGRVKNKFRLYYKGERLDYWISDFRQSIEIADNIIPDNVFPKLLPVSVQKIAVFETYSLEEFLTGEKAAEKLVQKFDSYLKSLRENGVKVIEKNTEMEDNEIEYTLSVELRLLGENTITAQDYQVTEN